MKNKIVSYIAFLFVFVLAFSSVANAQFDRFEKDRARQMLSNVKKAIEKNYYDANFHGINLEEKFKAADEKLKNATSLSQAFGVIAQAVLDFNDSHTFFVPPSRTTKVEYGWQMAIIGDKPYVISVKPKSDAAQKGLKVGDLILSVNGFKPNRKEMWKMNYYYYQISPRPGMNLVVQSPGGEPRELEVRASIKQRQRVIDLENDLDVNELIRESESESRNEYHRFQKLGNIVIWKMPSFSFEPTQVDELMKRRISGADKLILDLRGNGGGYIATLEKLAGYFFDKDTKIADVKRRKETKPMQTKANGANTFKGDVIVLVDSESGSSSEIFARFIQLEKRGYVIGDQTAGAVMQSRFYTMEMGAERVVMYGMSITDADIIMSDGKSIEHIGVTPDELIITSGEDLAANRDPILARAIEKAGGKITAEDAGRLFPIEWEN